MLRLGLRDFKRGLIQENVVVSGPGRELWALRKTGWLTSPAIKVLNDLIINLIDAIGKAEPRGRLYGLTVLLTPLGSRSGGDDARKGIRRTKGA
jgi:hypothetical protein